VGHVIKTLHHDDVQGRIKLPEHHTEGSAHDAPANQHYICLSNGHSVHPRFLKPLARPRLANGLSLLVTGLPRFFKGKYIAISDSSCQRTALRTLAGSGSTV
jgi:hypothetical protein